MANDDSITFVQNDLACSSFPIFEDIKHLGKLCDVTLKVEDRCFFAHRIILAGTIPYFHAMFTHDMVESTQEIITIKEIDPDFLFIYFFKYFDYCFICFQLTMLVSQPACLQCAASHKEENGVLGIPLVHALLQMGGRSEPAPVNRLVIPLFGVSEATLL
ncbi:UNVERIFIED_CONTAM: Kelch-like protein 18 [Trichonephila clavipes]